jgi:hypothetical protein
MESLGFCMPAGDNRDLSVDHPDTIHNNVLELIAVIIDLWFALVCC